MFKEMIAKVARKKPIDEEDFETRTAIGEPLKEKLKATKDPAEPKWIKNIKRQMDQL